MRACIGSGRPAALGGGTLVPGTSSSVVLAGFLGLRDELAKAEDAYAAGVLANRQVSELDAAGWAGVPEDQVSGRLDGLPLGSGITETVAWCWHNGLVPVLATLAWSPVGSYLTDRFGFHAFCGPRPETTGGRFTGRVARHFDEYGSRRRGDVVILGLPVALRCADAVVRSQVRNRGLAADGGSTTR